MGPKDTECIPMAFANWGGMSLWKGQWAKRLLVQAWCLRRDDVPRRRQHFSSSPDGGGQEDTLPASVRRHAHGYLLGTQANATTGNANKKATLGGGKSRAHCDPRWRTHNDLNATTTGPAVWAPGYYLSQYFSKSEKEEERKKKKKLCSIYEGSSVPSTVKLLYQGFRSCSATITC